MKYLTIISIACVIIYSIILTFTYIFQRNLLYNPTENNYSGDRLLFSVDKVKIKTRDNIELASWYHNKNINKFKTILFLHGNAGSLENRIHKINHFYDMNVNFLIIAWRGFSGNQGHPTERGLYEDAKSAVRWLRSQGILEKNIILYGESLGTGVAIEIAQNKKFAGIILESPFTSMIAVGKDKYPFLPVKLLLKDKYENNKKIKNIKIPILIMHGKIDKIVPFRMGKELYELANAPKYSYFSKYDDHMMNYDKNLLKVLVDYVDSLN